MAVPDELDERELGLVLAGRRRAFSGELVVGGHLVPEQREAVNRAATLIDLAQGAAPAPRTVEEQVRERARLASFSRRERRAFDGSGHRPGRGPDRQRPRRTGRPGPRSEQAVADAALGIAGGVTVIVLSGLPPRKTRLGRTLADALAAELARRGVTVILLAGSSRAGGSRSHRPARSSGADDAGKSRVEVEP